ncbi:MAG: hypothetical protein RLZZ546_852, partial [Bacteroidota bacterium]
LFMKLLLFLLILPVILSNCIAPQKTKRQFSSLEGKDLIVYGRSKVNEIDGSISLITSASHFGIQFYDQVELLANTQGENTVYLQYEINDNYESKKIKIVGNNLQKFIIKSPNNELCKLWIYKCSEAIAGQVNIHKIIGNSFSVLKKPKQKLIEFIGNSITCGAASDTSEFPCTEGNYHDHSNAYLAFGPRVSRELKVDFIINSISGAGIYRNWNSDGPTLPELYDFVDLSSLENGKYDHTQNKPNIISIALGTNDFSKGDGVKARLPFDRDKFVFHYIQFIKKIKNIHPKAIIVLTDSPMINGENKNIFNSCLLEIKKNVDDLYPLSQGIYIFTYKEMEPRGCSYHPSIDDHYMMAMEIKDFYKNLLESYRN